MPYVIAEPCIGVKDKSCVAVCPVDCIHDAADQLYIDPNECIDCGLCEPECPVDAIFMEDEVPDQWKKLYSDQRRLVQKVGQRAKRVGGLFSPPTRFFLLGLKAKRHVKRGHRVCAAAERSAAAVSVRRGRRATALLLHGWPETGHAWRRVLPTLAASGYVVVAPRPARGGGTRTSPSAATRRRRAWKTCGR